jgi:hypothetical protein
VDEDEVPGLVQPAQVFAPKSLVLVSRLDHTEVFRVQRTSKQYCMSLSDTPIALLISVSCYNEVCLRQI